MGWFTKYNASENRDTQTPQTDCYFGEKGVEPHGHVAFDHDGEFVAGRDVDGSPISPDQVSVPKK
jgi:hypothetical protein